MVGLSKEAGIHLLSEDMHLRRKIFEALSKDQKSQLISLMPEASVQEIMTKVETIEHWDKLGEDDIKKDKGLNVGVWDRERGRI